MNCFFSSGCPILLVKIAPYFQTFQKPRIKEKINPGLHYIKTLSFPRFPLNLIWSQLATMHRIQDGLTAVNTPYDILLMGQTSVDKTSLIYKFLGLTWAQPSPSPSGELHYTQISTSNYSSSASSQASKGSACHELSILDISSLSEEYYSSRKVEQIKNARTIIFAYSVTDRESFEALQYDIEAVMMMRNNTLPPFVVVGMKLDIYGYQLLYQEGEELAHKYGAAAFYEVSTHEGTNVESAFAPLIEEVLRRKTDERSSEVLSLLDVLSEEVNDASISLHKEESSREIVLSSTSIGSSHSQKKPQRTIRKQPTRHVQSEKTGCCIIM